MKRQSTPDIFLCAIGSAGDVYPFLGIGQELRKRGYRVTLITSQFFEIHARDAGLEFFGLGSAEEYQSIIQDPDLWDREKGFQVFAENVVLPSIEPVYDKPSGHESLSERLEKFLDAGDALLIFTPGTAMKHAVQFFVNPMLEK